MKQLLNVIAVSDDRVDLSVLSRESGRHPGLLQATATLQSCAMLFDAAAALLCSTSITATSTFYPSSTKGHCRLRNHARLLLLCALLLSTSRACHISQRPLLPSMARVYADVNQHMPRAYWDYDSVNISWGVLENYEVVRKIGAPACLSACCKTTS